MHTPRDNCPCSDCVHAAKLERKANAKHSQALAVSYLHQALVSAVKQHGNRLSAAYIKCETMAEKAVIEADYHKLKTVYQTTLKQHYGTPTRLTDSRRTT